MKHKRHEWFLDPSLVLYLPLHQLDGNTFMSKDEYGHQFAASGAAWTPRGRSFDGVDDQIAGPVLPFSTYSAMTILAWGLRTAGGRRFIVSAGYAPWQFQVGLAGTDRLSVELNIDGTYYHLVADTSAPLVSPSGEFRQMGFTHDLSTGRWVFYIDGRPYTTGTQPGMGYLGNNLVRIGAHVGLTSFWGGVLGEISIFNLALPPEEIQRNYIETNGRYR